MSTPLEWPRAAAVLDGPPNVATMDHDPNIIRLAQVTTVSQAEAYFVEHQHSTPVVLAMAVGLVTFEDADSNNNNITTTPDNNAMNANAILPADAPGGLVFYFKDPYQAAEKHRADKKNKSVDKRSKIMPQKHHLKDELLRRVKANDMPKPTKMPKTTAEYLKTLLEFPVRDVPSQEFILRQENKLRNFLIVQNKASADAAFCNTNARGNIWNSAVSYLRLFHVVVDDDIIGAYHHRNDVGDRLETDARNSSKRSATFYELAAEKYNDESFVPSTNVYLDLHNDFAKTIQLPQSICPTATPDSIKDKLQGCRSELAIMMSNWNTSGSGDGQKSDKTDDEPAGSQCNTICGDDRRAFLHGRKAYLLYMWQLFDDNDILAHCMSKLPEGMMASTECTAMVSVSSPQRKKHKPDNAEPLVHFATVAKAAQTMATSSTIRELERLENTLFVLQTQQVTETNPQMRDLLASRIEKQKLMIAKLQSTD
jgi:hypothetical protein